MSQRENRLYALVTYAEGQIALLKEDVEIYLDNAVGIGEHANVMEEMLNKIKTIAEWRDVIETVKEEFE